MLHSDTGYPQVPKVPCNSQLQGEYLVPGMGTVPNCGVCTWEKSVFTSAPSCINHTMYLSTMLGQGMCEHSLAIKELIPRLLLIFLVYAMFSFCIHLQHLQCIKVREVTDSCVCQRSLKTLNNNSILREWTLWLFAAE